MKKRIFSIILIVFILVIVGCKENNKQLTQKEKLNDFEYMYTMMKQYKLY